MNAKTTKFLAVLAVLAVAFAGVAVLVQEQSSDAAAGDAVTKDTYSDAITAKVFTSIKLENTPDEKSVVLYQNAVGKTTPATTVEAGMAYFFATDATGDSKVKMPDGLTLNKPIMFFILDGVTVEVAPSKLTAGAYAMIQVVCVKDYNAETGIIIPADDKYLDDKAKVNTLFDADGYAFNADGKAVQDLDYKAADRIYTYNNDRNADNTADVACSGFKIIADMTYDRNFILASLNGEADLYSDAVISKSITTANLKNKDMIVTMIDFTGKIVFKYDDKVSNEISVKNFTGMMSPVYDLDTPQIEAQTGLRILSCEAGTVGETSLGTLLVLNEGVSISFTQNVTLQESFAYVDEYNDIHMIVGNCPMKVGMDGLTVYAGNNMIGMKGTMILTGEEKVSLFGNVTLSGMIYTEGKTLEIKKIWDGTYSPKIESKSDVKLAGLQVVGAGAVTLNANVLVTEDTSFYVQGPLAVNKILKVADGAVVKAEGEFSMDTAVNGAAVWNAGQFVVPDYVNTEATGADHPATYYDDQLIRVYMNSEDGYGTFFAGSVEYNGSTAGTPLSVAYGAYLNITGICNVNLTSKNITVENDLYKYWTMILATNNTTIPLTVDYPNQYPATISLDGKDYSSVESTAKSATFRNVVWGSPDNAWINVTAPEVYTVVLAKTLTGTDPEKAVSVWTEDLTIKDQNRRVIPIDATTGQIQVVFGYEYTIEGANSTSNYKFISPNHDLEDLTKVSKTKGKFTMIRNNVDKETVQIGSENVLRETPVVLQITEGIATELTVYIDDSKEQLSEGDVFLHYAVADEDGEPIGDGTAVTVQVDKGVKFGVITGVYSNDVLLFKSEFVKYFASTAVSDPVGTTPANAKKVNVIYPFDTSTPAKEKETVKLDSKVWSDGFTFANITKTENKASFPLVCAPDTISVTFVFGADTTDSQRIIVEFTDYCGLADVHHNPVTKTRSQAESHTIPAAGEVPAREVKIFTISMCVGEVFNITWDDREGYLSEMTCSATVDGSAPATDREYVYGTDVAVKDEMALCYTLTEQELKYIIVENKTSNDLKLTIGRFSADIAKNKSNDKVIVNDVDNTLVLSKKGWTVEGWDFTITRGTADTTESTPCKTVHVSGPQTTQTFADLTALIQDSNNATTYVIKKITIVMTDMKKTLYNVDVPIDSHYAIDLYDRTGYMGDTQKVYITPIAEWTIEDVLYHYKEVDMTEEAVGHATRGTTPEGKEVWTYTMPASDVVLEPIYHKDARNLTFVDQDGVTVETMTKEPTTLVDMPVPVKPLCKVAGVTTSDLTEDEYDFNAETGYISFTMPDKDVVFTVTYVEIDYSIDVIVTVGQKGMPITLVITALDGKQIASGTIKMNVTYTYTDEDGEISTDVVTVTKNYVAGESTVIVDQEFITLLGDNYSGAFAVTGTFEFGYAVGSLSKTVYTPVLGA